jgi:hypothetical protein
MAISPQRTATPALAHALAAAERGFPVLPLSPTKLPALRSPHHGDAVPALCRGECGRPGHGVHDATTDPGAVRALFAAAPGATGYGVACGRPPHHLIGIDLDTTGPGDSVADSLSALRDLAVRYLFTVPETVTVLTPSGGRHLWLTGPADIPVPNSAGRLAPGIDVRGSGGYLVGPGSVSVRGAYRLAPGTAALTPAPCPRALLRLIARPSRPHSPPHTRRHPSHGRGLVDFVLAAREGRRNTRLFWAACRAYENGIGDALREPLTQAAISTGLPEREARATIASANRLTSIRSR